ncbi:unnamed protein product [Lactuca virosa]|uniref:Uncharacterized protein n=1 Tax=Lactuca virosa TaxID=75947 RepID=A0AAU9N3K4_9ASTR|nr:unnamed protein product [Lactuca virosa]
MIPIKQSNEKKREENQLPIGATPLKSRSAKPHRDHSSSNRRSTIPNTPLIGVCSHTPPYCFVARRTDRRTLLRTGNREAGHLSAPSYSGCIFLNNIRISIFNGESLIDFRSDITVYIRVF